MKKRVINLALILFLLISCQKTESNRVTILDEIIHVEDSIHYYIPNLPRFCELLYTEKQFVNIGDCNLYCEIEGDGVPMILINGGPGGSHHYFHPWFSKAKSFCKIIYYDQRGCGQSDFNKDDGYSFIQAVEDLEKLRIELRIKKWIVCGHSYGGALAQYYTTIHPDRVLGMVLISSSPLLHDERLYETRQDNYIRLIESKKFNQIRDLHKEGQLDYKQLFLNLSLNGEWKKGYFYKPTKDQMVINILYGHVIHSDNGLSHQIKNSLYRYNFQNVFDNCPIPTLICEGKYDLRWEEEKPIIFKQNHPNSKFVMFDSAGHRVFVDQPELFFSTLKEFVSTLNPISNHDLNKWREEATKILVPQVKLFKNEDNFFDIIVKEGIKEAVVYYKDFKKINPGEFLFTEIGMALIGYSYLNKREYENAIKIFEINVEAYPKSWKVYDSLGEGYMWNGDIEEARDNYRKSIELNPNNENGKRMLKKLNA